MRAVGEDTSSAIVCSVTSAKPASSNGLAHRGYAARRQRIRGLRRARGWSLDALASRCHLSPSTLSRLETGHRRISLEALLPIARALGTTIDELVETVTDDDVVIRPPPTPRRDPSHDAVVAVR